VRRPVARWVALAVAAGLAAACSAGSGAATAVRGERSGAGAGAADPVMPGELPPSLPALAPDPAAPDTTAPDTTAPDTTAPDTAAPDTAAPDTAAPLRMVFTGDVLLHSPLWAEALADGGGTHDFAPMFDDLRPVVATADLAVCHLETPVAPPFEAFTSSPRYGVPAEIVDSLAASGFDHCSTASNHTFDRGVAGVDATVVRFEQVGITQHGMASEPSDIEPVLLEVGGITVGHVSATYGFDLGAPPRDEPWRSNRIDVARLVDDARLARERGADVVVLSLHWGNSNSHQASADQRAIATELSASQVVDLVVGHHAHVVQPIERIGSMWVAYGLGNVLSNMPLGSGPFTGADTGDGVVLEAVLDPSLIGAGPPGSAVTQLVARPVWVDRAAGWVVRDLASARRDPVLMASIGAEVEASWARTAAVVGAYLPTG
jgi:hypothetical protein